MRWSNPSDSTRLRQMFSRFIERSKTAAKRRGVHHRFLFQNHAFEEEDVFTGYGETNLQRLRSIRQRVDPQGIFQTLQPGYFKLGLGKDQGNDRTGTADGLDIVTPLADRSEL